MSAGAFLILASASGILAQRPADAPTGSLSGQLTDLHSRPVDGAMLVLRNAATGDRGEDHHVEERVLPLQLP